MWFGDGGTYKKSGGQVGCGSGIVWTWSQEVRGCSEGGYAEDCYERGEC